MPKIIDLPFSDRALMGGIKLTVYDENELRNHGAPCRVSLLRGNMPEKHMHEVGRIVREMLNALPDEINLRPIELTPNMFKWYFNIKAERGWWTYPNDRGRHSGSGGEDYTDFDAIRREDIAVVTDKVLRELRGLGVIHVLDYQEIRQKLEEEGLSAPKFEGEQGREDFKRPYKNLGGYGLAMDAAAYLEEHRFRTPEERHEEARQRYLQKQDRIARGIDFTRIGNKNS